MIQSYNELVGIYCLLSDDQGDSAGCDDGAIVSVYVFVYNLETKKEPTIEHFRVENDLGDDTNSSDGDEIHSRKKHILADVINEINGMLMGRTDEVKSCQSCLCTFGCEQLRMVLHPTCFKEGIILTDCFYKYFDLKSIVQSRYNPESEFSSIENVLDYLRIDPDLSADTEMRNIKNMANLVERLLSEGHTFTEPEKIMMDYKPGNWTGEVVGDEFVVKARGLPWQSTEADVANFFKGLNIARGGVVLCMSAQGRKNGEAMVRFETKEQRNLALKKHRHHLGSRYIEVFRSTGKEFVYTMASGSKEAKAILMQQYEMINPVIIRMRGLPYTCRPSQVVEFFRAEPNSCEVLDGEDGVLFIYQSEGRTTGDAFVLLTNEEEAAKALTKHKQCIGTRYIELFKSTTAEVQQVLNKNFDPRSPSLLASSNPSLVSYLGHSSFYQSQKQQQQSCHQPCFVLPSQGISTAKDCVRFVGLPLETSVNDLVIFLSDHAKDVRHRGVHLVYSAEGYPTGEAFIEMVGEKQAESLRDNRNGRMILVSGHRYVVQTQQCSFDDMAALLWGGQLQLPVPYPLTPTCSATEHLNSPTGFKSAENTLFSPVPFPPLHPQCQLGYHPLSVVTILPTSSVLPTVPVSPLNSSEILYITSSMGEKVNIY